MHASSFFSVLCSTYACNVHLYSSYFVIAFLVERPLEKQVRMCPEELPFLNNIK